MKRKAIKGGRTRGEEEDKDEVGVEMKEGEEEEELLVEGLVLLVEEEALLVEGVVVLPVGEVLLI